MRAVLGSSLRLRPALVEQVLDLEQRRDLVRGGVRRRARVICRLGQPRGDPVDFFAGQLLAGADLVDDVRGRLGQEGLVAELACGARQFLLRGGQILLQPAPFGGDVDGARRVEFDDDGAAATAAPRRAADGLKPSSAAVSHASDRDRGDLRVEVGFGDVRTAAQAPSAGR